MIDSQVALRPEGGVLLVSRSLENSATMLVQHSEEHEWEVAAGATSARAVPYPAYYRWAAIRNPVALRPNSTLPSKSTTDGNVATRRTLSWVSLASTICEAMVRFQIRS